MSMETEHLELRVQVWRYWKGASVAVSLTPENYCNWQVWEVWEVWIRPSRPLHVFLMEADYWTVVERLGRICGTSGEHVRKDSRVLREEAW